MSSSEFPDDIHNSDDEQKWSFSQISSSRRATQTHDSNPIEPQTVNTSLPGASRHRQQPSYVPPIYERNFGDEDFSHAQLHRRDQSRSDQYFLQSPHDSSNLDHFNMLDVRPSTAPIGSRHSRSGSVQKLPHYKSTKGKSRSQSISLFTMSPLVGEGGGGGDGAVSIARGVGSGGSGAPGPMAWQHEDQESYREQEPKSRRRKSTRPRENVTMIEPSNPMSYYPERSHGMGLGIEMPAQPSDPILKSPEWFDRTQVHPSGLSRFPQQPPQIPPSSSQHPSSYPRSHPLNQLPSIHQLPSLQISSRYYAPPAPTREYEGTSHVDSPLGSTTGASAAGPSFNFESQASGYSTGASPTIGDGQLERNDASLVPQLQGLTPHMLGSWTPTVRSLPFQAEPGAIDKAITPYVPYYQIIEQERQQQQQKHRKRQQEQPNTPIHQEPSWQMQWDADLDHRPRTAPSKDPRLIGDRPYSYWNSPVPYHQYTQPAKPDNVPQASPSSGHRSTRNFRRNPTGAAPNYPLSGSKLELPPMNPSSELIPPGSGALDAENDQIMNVPSDNYDPAARSLDWSPEAVTELVKLLDPAEKHKWKFISDNLSERQKKRIPLRTCKQKFEALFGEAETSSALQSSLFYVAYRSGWDTIRTVRTAEEQDAEESRKQESTKSKASASGSHSKPASSAGPSTNPLSDKPRPSLSDDSELQKMESILYEQSLAESKTKRQQQQQQQHQLLLQQEEHQEEEQHQPQQQSPQQSQHQPQFVQERSSRRHSYGLATQPYASTDQQQTLSGARDSPHHNFDAGSAVREAPPVGTTPTDMLIAAAAQQHTLEELNRSSEQLFARDQSPEEFNPES